MMKTKLSILAASALLATSLQADSFDLKDALQSGTVSGDFTLYGEWQNNESGNDSGFTMGSFGLGYESESYKGFKANVGFRANHDFDEDNDGDYDGGADDPKVLLHTANISYTNEYFTFTAGRQELGFEWVGDFHEAYVASITAIEDTTITIAHSDRFAVADADAVLEDWTKTNGSDGLNLVDVVYEGIEGAVLNAYYYNANDVANWYGIKADYDTDMFGVTGHYAASSEDVGDDGSAYHLEARGSFSGFGLNAGYIGTDKDVGAGSMANYDDNMSPFEDGNQVYGADASTYYIGASYEVASVGLSAVFGETEYGSAEESEFNFAAEYSFTDELSVGALFVDVGADNSANDYNKFTLTATYAF